MPVILGERRAPAPVETRPEEVIVPWPLALLGWACKGIGRVTRWCFRHPASVLILATGLAVWNLTMLAGGWIVYPLVMASIAGMVAWRIRWPDSFRTRVAARWHGSIRAATTYRLRWEPTMETLALGKRICGRQYQPRLVKVRSLGPVDVLTVRLLVGQTTEDWIVRADRFASTFGALDCRITTSQIRRGRIELRLLREDPFRVTIDPFTQRDSLDLKRIPLALTEEGLRFYCKLLGNHILVGGATDAGKSSVIQQLIDQLAPAVRSGHVQLWGIDMKRGAELAHCRDLFTRFVYDSLEDAADCLERLVELMNERGDRYMGKTRQHIPTPEEPLMVLLIDELAALTEYVNDSALKKRLANALKLLLSQGRMPGFAVVGAVQDPRKETVPMRNLFPYRIAMRTIEAADVALLLSAGARDRGARCDQISTETPGVAYVEIDGKPEPVRVRFPYVTDQRIAETVAAYAPHHDQAETADVIALRPDTGNDADESGETA